MAKKEERKPADLLAVRSVQIRFNLEQYTEDGKLIGVQEVPVMLYEAQFNQTVASLAAALLEQANRSPEPKAKGEDKKEE